METVEEKVGERSIAERVGRTVLKVTFHPTGIRDGLDYLHNRLGLRESTRWYPRTQGTLVDIYKYVLYSAILLKAGYSAFEYLK